MKRVLITCVGSGVGQSVVDSLKSMKDRYFVVGSDQNRYTFARPDCDDFVSLPSIFAPDYLDALLDACRAHAIDVAIPGHDYELALFARHIGRFDAAGVRAIVSDVRLVELLRDKLAWAREFRKHTDRVVASYSPADLRAGATVALPAIAKPSAGSASAGLRILHSLDDLAGVPEDHVVQPFLFPLDDDPEAQPIRAAVAAGRVVQLSEISVQLTYSRDGELLGRFASRNKLKAGVPTEVQPLDEPEVWSAIDALQRVLEPYRPRGPVNVQGRMTPDGLIFFEMNPRFTGITGNRAQFGYNEVSLLVDNFVDGTTRPLYTNARKVGVRQVACRTWPNERFGGVASATGKAIVITGGTGWLARQVAQARAAHGDAVTVVCREASLERARELYASQSQVRIVSAASPGLHDVFASADVLVNLASGRPPHGTAAIQDAHAHQLRLLDLAETSELPAIVNVSSQSVYDDAGSAAKDERAPLDVNEPYAFSKYAIEQSVESMSRRRPSLSAVNLRLARLFGAAPGLRAHEFPHRAVRAALDGTPIEVWRSDDVLDLLDVRDAADAVGFMIDSMHGRRATTFNVGSGAPGTVGEYLALVDEVARDRLGRGLVREVKSTEARNHAGLDCTRLARAGWSPTRTLRQSIEDLFEYLKNER